MDPIRVTTTSVALWCLMLGACSRPPAVPPALAQAREQFDAAAEGPAPRVAPVDFEEARDALQRANQAHRGDPSSESVPDLAYVATRKIQLAESRASARLNEVARARSEAAARRAAARNVVVPSNGTLAKSQERKIDGRVTAAGTDASKLAVVTSVFFASGKAALGPAGKANLARVVELLKQNPDRVAFVEGHTDSVGSGGENLKLSLSRAQAVRDYLVANGVAAERVVAFGVGPAHPRGRNDADNRRVDLMTDGPWRAE